MKQIGSEEWVKRQIAPHGARLRKCIKAAVARLNRISAEDRLAFNGRCAADVLNSFVIAEARDAFDGVSGSEFHEKNGTTYHSLCGCVLWYKQLNQEHLPSNLPTLTIDQMMQGQFDFMPDKFLVIVGYELDTTKQKLKTVELMRFGPGRRIEFVIKVVEVVTVVPVAMPKVANRLAARRRTKVGLRVEFEQKAFLSERE